MVYYPITLIWHDMTWYDSINLSIFEYAVCSIHHSVRCSISLHVFDRCAVWICLVFLARPETESCLFCGCGLGPLGTILPGPVTHGRTIQGYRGNSWDTHGIPMGYPWDTYGIPMGYLWDTYGIPMGYLRWPEVPVASVAAAVGPSIGTCLKGSPRGWLQPLQLMTYWWHVDHINPRSQRPLNAARHNGAPKPIL